MKNISFIFLASLFVFACEKSSDVKIKSEDKGVQQLVDAAPVIEKRPVVITMHGDTRIDNYAWLKNLNIMLGKEEPSAELQKVIEEQNAYTSRALKPTTELFEILKGEFQGRQEDRDNALAIPAKIGEYEYWKETKSGETTFRYYRQKLGTQDKELLIDGPALAGSAAYFEITIGDISPQGLYLPFLVDEDGDRAGTLYIKNLKTGEVSEVHQKNVKGGYNNPRIAWSLDEKYIFFSVPGTLSRDSKVVKADISQKPFKETTVYDELDGDFFLSLTQSASKKFIFLNSTGHDVTVFRAVDAANTEAPLIEFGTKRLGHEYSVDHAGDQFIIRSNRIGGVFSIWTTSTEKPQESNWKPLKTVGDLPPPEKMKVFNEFLYIEGHLRGDQDSAIISLKDGQVFTLPKPDIMSAIQEVDNYDSSGSIIRYSIWSPIQHNKVVEMNMKDRSTTVLMENPIRNFNPDEFEILAEDFPSADGTLIKSYIVKKKSLKGKVTPVFMDPYGHYGSYTIRYYNYMGLWGFDVWSLLNRGVAIVTPILRGSSDMGVPWKDAGSLKNKLKTLEDTVAVIKGLSDRGFSAPDKIVVRGYSAGGINAGYIATHAPKSVKALIARAAFVDVLNTMSDITIPLTTQEFNVWGNPIESQDDYLRIKSYSPVDNTPDQEYPAIFASISLHDSQVPYWEPMKWIANIRDHQKGNAPILMQIYTVGGHGGGVGSAEIEQNAQEQAFILHQMGISH